MGKERRGIKKWGRDKRNKRGGIGEEKTGEVKTRDGRREKQVERERANDKREEKMNGGKTRRERGIKKERDRKERERGECERK